MMPRIRLSTIIGGYALVVMVCMAIGCEDDQGLKPYDAELLYEYFNGSHQDIEVRSFTITTRDGVVTTCSDDESIAYVQEMLENFKKDDPGVGSTTIMWLIKLETNKGSAEWYDAAGPYGIRVLVRMKGHASITIPYRLPFTRPMPDCIKRLYDKYHPDWDEPYDENMQAHS